MHVFGLLRIQVKQWEGEVVEGKSTFIDITNYNLDYLNENNELQEETNKAMESSVDCKDDIKKAKLQELNEQFDDS